MQKSHKKKPATKTKPGRNSKEFWQTLNEIEAETSRWSEQTKKKLNYLVDDYSFQREPKDQPEGAE